MTHGLDFYCMILNTLRIFTMMISAIPGFLQFLFDASFHGFGGCGLSRTDPLPLVASPLLSRLFFFIFDSFPLEHI